MNAAHLIGSAQPVFCPSVRVSILILTLIGLTGTGTAKADEQSSNHVRLKDPWISPPGAITNPGTILHIPGRGFTFTIPHGWHATVFEDSELPFLTPTREEVSG